LGVSQKEHLACEKLTDEVLTWLSVWLQMILHVIHQADATVTPSSLASLKSRIVQPFWCRLTQVVLEKQLCLSLLATDSCMNSKGK